MIFRVVLLITLISIVISQDFKGLKAPQAGKRTFVPPSRRTVFRGKADEQIVKGAPQQQQQYDLKAASSDNIASTDEDASADDNQDGFDQADHADQGDHPDHADHNDEHKDSPVIHNEQLLKNDDQREDQVVQSPVKTLQHPVQQEAHPVKAPILPQKPIPLAPAKGGYSMDSKGLKAPQIPIFQSDELPYFRRPAVTLLRTPWGFEASEGLAVVLDGPQYMAGLPQAPIYQQQYHDQVQQNHN